MDFLPVAPRDSPKMTMDCLAVIIIGGNAPNGRRMSTGSNEEGGGLARVLSGGRRRSGAGLPHGGENGDSPGVEGTWYWRAHIGLSNDTLFILPESTNPVNHILKVRPVHVASNHTRTSSSGHQKTGSGGFMGAIRRASAGFIHKPESAHPPAPADGTIPESAVEDSPTSPTGAVRNDDEAHRETGWPAVVEGQALKGIVIPLHNISKDSVHLETKKGYNVSASIGSAIAGKAGHIRFEFPKDSMSSKGEAELLFNKLSTGVESTSPLFTSVKLGGNNTTVKNSGDAEYNPTWQGQVRGKW